MKKFVFKRSFQIFALALGMGLTGCFDNFAHTRTDYVQNIHSIAWSPDQKQLAFVYMNARKNQYVMSLWIVNLDGSGLKQLTQPHEINQEIIEWDEDSQNIVLEKGQNAYLINPQTKSSEPIGDNQVDVTFVKNNYVLFHGTGGPSLLKLFDKNASPHQIRTEKPEDQDKVVWISHVSPYSNHVYFRSERGSKLPLNSKAYHGIAELDFEKALLKNIQFFKTYDVKQIGSNKETGYAESNLTFLGWENKDTILYFESKRLQIFSYNLQTQVETSHPSFQQNGIYSPDLKYQASNDTFWNELVISKVDGSERKVILKYGDALPKGEKFTTDGPGSYIY